MTRAEMMEEALEVLRRKTLLLNGRADDATLELSAVNDHLAQFQPGVETWLEQLLRVGDERLRIGYAKVEGGWQLAVCRRGEEVPLRLESRAVRICAAPMLPALVSAITGKLDGLLLATGPIIQEIPCLDPTHQLDEPDPFLGPERLNVQLRDQLASVVAAAWALLRPCWNEERGWVDVPPVGKMEALKTALERAAGPSVCERCDRSLGADNTCSTCQLVHGESCPRCGQRALHTVACQGAREQLAEVHFSSGDGTVQVLRVSQISGGFPRGADGTCAFCAGDPLAERSGNETLIGAFFLRVAQRHGEGDTCPCCNGKPT